MKIACVNIRKKIPIMFEDFYKVASQIMPYDYLNFERDVVSQYYREKYEMKNKDKLKIVVVGIGKTGCVLVDNKSKEVNHDDMKFVRIDKDFDESNPNATDIRLASILPHKTSFEEILEYLEYEGSRKRLLKFLATVQEGDELYKMKRITGCITTASDTRGIRLKRNGEIIDYVEIDYSILAL